MFAVIKDRWQAVSRCRGRQVDHRSHRRRNRRHRAAGRSAGLPMAKARNVSFGAPFVDGASVCRRGRRPGPWPQRSSPSRSAAAKNSRRKRGHRASFLTTVRSLRDPARRCQAFQEGRRQAGAEEEGQGRERRDAGLSRRRAAEDPKADRGPRARPRPAAEEKGRQEGPPATI